MVNNDILYICIYIDKSLNMQCIIGQHAIIIQDDILHITIVLLGL